MITPPHTPQTEINSAYLRVKRLETRTLTDDQVRAETDHYLAQSDVFRSAYLDALTDQWVADQNHFRALDAHVITHLAAREIRQRRDQQRGSLGGLVVCAYCGDPTYHEHVDHVIPLSRGGANVIGNVVIACAACNWSKGVRTQAEFLVSVWSQHARAKLFWLQWRSPLCKWCGRRPHPRGGVTICRCCQAYAKVCGYQVFGVTRPRLDRMVVALHNADCRHANCTLRLGTIRAT